MVFKETLRVCVTGAAGQISYSLLPAICSGSVFGLDQPIILSLLEIPQALEALHGVIMELQDCAFPLLLDVIPTDDPLEAFKDADAVFLVGAMPRKQGMERKDLLSANAKIFKVQGEALEKVARKSVKVVVVGNPANTNAWILKKCAPSIPSKNITALTRLDQNRAYSQIATRLSIPINCVKNVIIWGNHSSTQFPDVKHAHIITGEDDGSKTISVEEAFGDHDYLESNFVPDVQGRGAAVIAARKLSSAMSAARATAEHMKDWWFGTADGEFVSMAVISDGSYGIPEGLVFSFPVHCKDGEWFIVQNLDINDQYSMNMLKATQRELEEEQKAAHEILSSMKGKI